MYTRHRLVHLDLKGAAPRSSYLQKIIPLLSKWGATGLLIEYEDMFPYHSELKQISRLSAYSEDQIHELITLAEHNNLIVIPLIQTFGHLEFVLKHDKFRHLREVDLYPSVLCPIHPNCIELILSLIGQLMALHPNSRQLHIGADEVWYLGKCEKCVQKMQEMNWDTFQLYLNHISKIAKLIKERFSEIDVIIWDDMLRKGAPSQIQDFDLGNLVEPMIWKYDAKEFDIPVGMYDHYAKIFNRIWVASAFKGATGSTQFIPPIQHHLNNHLQWLEVLKEQSPKFKEVCGIALTGWQRYDHYAVLCEMLPVSLPCLALCLKVLLKGLFTEEDHESVSKELGFQSRINVHPFPRPQILEQAMTFPGHELYVGIQIWSNFMCNLQRICNSEGMLGWFSDYFRSKNFTNPAQVENILYPMVELQNNLRDLKTNFESSLRLVFFEDTVEEWIGCFFDPGLKKIDEIVQDCRRQIQLGMRKDNDEFNGSALGPKVDKPDGT